MQYGEDFVVSLKKVNGDPVKNKKLIVKVTNKNVTYKLKTNSKGKAIVPIKYLGTLKMKISFPGNDMFVKSSTKADLTVEKGSTKIEGSDDSVGKGFNYYITLFVIFQYLKRIFLFICLFSPHCESFDNRNSAYCNISVIM